MSERKPKVVVIVGPTASGKTGLSIEIAKAVNAEIISADSRQVYRGLDIGSGKVTEAEMEGIPHYMLDVADPMSIYTAADYAIGAGPILEDILKRKKTPIIVGGTFFYIDMLLGKIKGPEVPPDPKLRKELEPLDATELYAELLEKDPARAATIDRHNKVRLIRALEIVASLGSVPTFEPEVPYDILTLGIDMDKEILNERIHTRLFSRLETGLIEEVEGLHARGVSWERLEELGLEYRYIALYLQDKVNKEEMLQKLETEIRRYAKRQRTWLRRDKSIKWFKVEEVKTMIEEVEGFLKR